MATIDLGKIKLLWRGTYNNGTAYAVDDVVEYTDTAITSTYICTAASTGNAPSSGGTAHGSWDYMAKGAAGTPTTTRGDIIRRGASADERLAKGTEGHILTMGANDPAWAAPAAGGSNANLIINGDGDICQRRDTQTAVSNSTNEGYYCWDRWATFITGGSSGVATLTRSTDSPAHPNPKFGSCLKVSPTTADTSVDADAFWSVYQAIEAQVVRGSGWDYSNTSSNLTLSFWVKSSKTGTHCVWFETADGTAYWLVKEYTVSSAGTWEKKSITIPGHASLQIDHNDGRGLLVGFVLQAGTDWQKAADSWTTGTDYATSNQVNIFDSTSNDFYLTGVKLEFGDTATDWQFEDHMTKLNKCRRYFQKQVVGVRVGPTGGSWNNTESGCVAYLQPSMRAAPSFAHSGTAADYLWQKGDGANGYETVSALAIGTGVTTEFCRLETTHSGNTNTGQVGWLSAASGTEPLYFSAEI